MLNLPEGVSVIMTYVEYNNKLCRTRKMTQGYAIAKACIAFRETNRKFRIYPISSKTKYTKVNTSTAWNEGMTLKEFEEYLND
ncbi:hypothetical protein AU156_gp070 [Edwardsiella phage PEi20]|uniref:Uncharacterized protein n=2 Tax=Kanagawavirus pei20 TaxID=2844109 RepID=A0A0B6VTT9_9CAUD|nr:hypothetical protein AU156_gp070 [Edwardsiella phage PEi20]BAQ22720.1 conserved hypothetical protein [Edwardsiella phage PEi20]BAQ23021.1 conserved hypothetical protein [Edwardsiella phage PEi26]